jgi:hypothetical protein
MTDPHALIDVRPLPELIAELRELLAKATPGPWREDKARGFWFIAPHPKGGWWNVGDCTYGRARGGLAPTPLRAEANAALIVALVNAAPTLLAALEKMTETRADG